MTGSGIRRLEQRLKDLAGTEEADAGRKRETPSQAWRNLTRDWLRETLKRSVRMAGESLEEEEVLRRCWTLARPSSILEAIRDAQIPGSVGFSETEDLRISAYCRRLHRNFAGLIATAAAAAAAVRAVNAIVADAGAPLRMRR